MISHSSLPWSYENFLLFKGNGVASNVKTTTTTTAFGTGSSQAYTASSGANYGYSQNYGSSQQYNY